MSRPIITHNRLRFLHVAAPVLSVVALVLAMYLVFYRAPHATHRRDQQVLGLQSSLSTVTVLGEKNQQRLTDLGQPSIGPPAASVSAGKATVPPSIAAAPNSSPTSQYVQPTQEQVNTGVEAFFRTNPPKTPFDTNSVVAKIVPYVTAYLHSHPAAAGKNGQNGATGKDGKSGTNGTNGVQGSPGVALGPTDEQVNLSVQTFLPAAVASYLTANPPSPGAPGPSGAPGRDGRDGVDGSPGPGPTQEQIASVVASYFADHPLACPSGYTAGQETVTTDTGPVLAYVCIADTQPTVVPPPPASDTPPTDTGSPTP